MTQTKSQNYEKTLIGVDPVILTIIENKLKVLLKKREKEPFSGQYELPGGIMLEKEDAESTIKRKLQEILENNKIFFTQFHTFTKPDRDPRKRIISIAYVALVSSDKITINDAWFEMDKLPKIAFDHKQIIEKAIEYLQNNLNELVARQFLPEHFPINRLQEVYELIEQKTYDNRNFRKKMIESGIVEETNMTEEQCSHRPGKLYRFKTY